MTREQHLHILILLSTLESLILAQKVPIPAGLFEDIDLATEALRKEILQRNNAPASGASKPGHTRIASTWPVSAGGGLW